MSACVDLWCDLMDKLDAMRDNKQVSIADHALITDELTDALWDTGNIDATRNNLHALAVHYGIELPEAA